MTGQIYRRDPGQEQELERLARCGMHPFDEYLYLRADEQDRLDRLHDYAPAGAVLPTSHVTRAGQGTSAPGEPRDTAATTVAAGPLGSAPKPGGRS